MIPFWKARRSATFKTHFFSALSRSLFTNSSLIFANSMFVKSVGGKGYSQLFFFSTLCALLYYVYFATRGDKRAYVVYRAVIALTIASSAGCFLEPFCPALQPYDHIMLYLFAISVMTVDLIGTTLGPVILQTSVNPAIFREVYQKIVTSELIARIAAAALVWIMSANHWLIALYPIGWILLVVHNSLFGVTIWRMRVAEIKAGIQRDPQTSMKEVVSQSLRFVFANPLLRTAMVIMIWTYVTKFVVEYLFYQIADSTFPSARQIAQFVSSTTIAMLVLSLIVQHFIGRKITEREQLSTLFSVQPINILIFGGLALLLPPFWPLVLLMVTYTIVNRSIQLPVSRQCLVPIPRARRGTIVSVITIFISTATLIMSGLMAALQKSLHLHDFLVLLLALAAGIFLLITGLDSFYIRNLWSFFREVRSGNWQDEPQLETLSSAELEAVGSVDDVPTFSSTTDLQSHPILETYANSFDRPKLRSATIQHRQLLKSGESELLLLGLRICFISGFPWFASLLSRSFSHDDPRVRLFAQRMLEVNSKFSSMSGYTAVFRRRIKALAMELLEDESQPEAIQRLRNLLKVPDHAAAESLVRVLTDNRYRDLRVVLIECIEPDGSRVSLLPMVNYMFNSDYQNAQRCREVLEQLSFGGNSDELRTIVEARLATLKREDLRLDEERSPESGPAAIPSNPLQLLMHTLFTEELRLCPKELDKALTDTISEFQVLSLDERAILVDMHLSFLKRSDFFKSWQTLMAE